MSLLEIINQLELNQKIFSGHLSKISANLYHWRPHAAHWNLVEIVCHLYDTEREDFRARVQHCLEHPDTLPPSIEPSEWVESRKYAAQDYEEMVGKFLQERKENCQWLKSLADPQWQNSYHSKDFGKLSAAFFLRNWLAHDLLHIRQITRVKYLFLKEFSGSEVGYAGKW